MKLSLYGLIALLIYSSWAFAAPEEPAELSSRFEYYHADYRLNEDGSHTETHAWARKVLQERALSGAKQASIHYSTSIQKAETLEAYTRKADGRRIDVPKSNFQVEVNSGKDKDAPVFSDITRLTVVFPEVAVGDTVVFAYKITQTEAMFPKHFSTMGIYSKLMAYDDVRVSFDWPSSLWVQYEARQMTEKEKTEKDGRKTITWTLQNPQPPKSKRRNYSVYDVEQEPGFAFSTFKSYQEIAAAYGARANPKAAVTEEIRKLADDLTKDKQVPREQAKSLYDWVATKIDYAGNCIGVGAVVPHDTAFILKNHMGDCKDHATLLQAMLAAKNIPSTQALINSGSIYRLPKIPVVSMVNHVLNYIPSLNLYADATSETTPFGMLPFSAEDKPVLLVDGFRDGTKTPASLPGNNRQGMKAVLKIDADGSVSGNIAVALNGGFAIAARDNLRDMPKEDEKDYVKNVLEEAGYIGSGKLDKEDPKELLDHFRYSVDFSFKDFIQRPGAGAFYIYPPFPTEAPIRRFAGSATDNEEVSEESVCWGGISSEEYTYQFPKQVKILSIPENMSISDGLFSYQAKYRLKGNKLTVKRLFEDKTLGNICSAKVINAYNKFAAKVRQNLKEQVVYK